MSDIKTKFINDPENITAELLEGYVLAYPNQVKLAAENIVVRANPKGNDKVAIVTLGGSGHEPALSGFVGEGMLDCSVVGDVFAAPGAQRLFQALQLMDREAGILLVVLNHSGDVMSANMACQLAARKGIKVKKLLTHDDISAGIGANIDDRRGLAGCVPLYKILGAAAEEGKSLDELIEIGERYNKNVATLAVAMRSCTHPQNGGTITNLPDGIMEIGMGQHGEGGGGQKPLVSADDTAAEMVDLLCQQLQPKAGDKMLLIINGVGATTHMELNIIFRKAYKELEAMCKLCQENGLYAGMSNCFQDILNIEEYYNQALRSIELGTCKEHSPNLFSYQNYYLEHMLNSFTLNESSWTFCHPKMQFLLDYDKEHHSELAYTLYMYLTHERNLAATAEAMDMHRTSLVYRFKKINTLIGEDFDNYRERMYLILSYEMNRPTA